MEEKVILLSIFGKNHESANAVLLLTGCEEKSLDKEENFNFLMDENAIIVEKRR